MTRRLPNPIDALRQEIALLRIADDINQSLRQDWMQAVDDLRLDVAVLQQEIHEIEIEEEERAYGN